MKNDWDRSLKQGRTVPAAERLRNWERRYDPERIRRIIEADKPVMACNARAAFEQQAAVELALKVVLAEFPVSTCQVANYHCYARELSKLARLYSGGTLAAGATEKYLKWYRRGLDGEILRAVAFRLFNIQLPENPGDAVPTGEGA